MREREEASPWRGATIDDVRTQFAIEISEFGYDSSARGAFLPTNSSPTPHFYFLNWPADWLDLYIKNNFADNDPVVAEGRRRIGPFTWREARAARPHSRLEDAMWDATIERGWTDGFVAPIHGPGGYYGLVVLAGRERPMTAELRYHLYMLCFRAHERCRELSGAPASVAGEAPLTARELECMRWVAAGKTDWEIGAIVGLSPLTVKSHVNEARRKLGAKTRSQAVARLMVSTAP